MKNNFLFFFLAFIFLLFCILNYESLRSFFYQGLTFIIDYKNSNFILFISLLVIFNFILFLTPVPTFPLIIANGFLLGNVGLFFSYFLIVTCSSILFKTSKIFSIFFKKYSIYKNLYKKINLNKNNNFNFLIIASSRYILPYFVHNIFFGSIIKSYNIFLYAVILSELPIVYVLNKIGKHIEDYKSFENFEFTDIFEFEYLFSLIIVFFLIFIIIKSSKYLKKKIN